MADNAVGVTAGSGLLFGSDQIGGVEFPRVKIVWGPDGTVNDADIASGKSLPVQLRTAAGTAFDLGISTGGSATPRVAIDTAQLGPLPTAAQAMATGGYTLVGLATDSPGLAAHDAVDTGASFKIGLKATSSLSALTPVATADRTDGFAGTDGVQIVRPHCNLEDIVTGNATNTDGTSTACIAAQAAGIKTYIVSIVLCNTSAVAITVDIKDGATTKLSLPLPAGGGCVYTPSIPIPGTAATAWNFDGSAAATTVTCSMVGFKSKV